MPVAALVIRAKAEIFIRFTILLIAGNTSIFSTRGCSVGARDGSDRASYAILCFVIFCQQVDVIRTGTIEVLLRLKILEDGANTILLAFMGYPQGLSGKA